MITDANLETSIAYENMMLAAGDLDQKINRLARSAADKGDVDSYDAIMAEAGAFFDLTFRLERIARRMKAAQLEQA
jgi:hypothetical protein